MPRTEARPDKSIDIYFNEGDRVIYGRCYKIAFTAHLGKTPRGNPRKSKLARLTDSCAGHK